MLCVSRFDSSLGCLYIDIYACSPRGLAFLKAVDIDANDGVDNVFTGALTNAIIEVGHTSVV